MMPNWKNFWMMTMAMMMMAMVGATVAMTIISTEMAVIKMEQILAVPLRTTSLRRRHPDFQPSTQR